MKVGTRLLLLSTFSAAVALSGWFVSQWSSSRLNEAMTQLEYANSVQRAVTRLNTRFGLYLSYHDADALSDWQRARAQLNAVLDGNPETSGRFIHSISRQNQTLQSLTPLLGREDHDSPGQVQLTNRIYATLQEMTEDTVPLAAQAQQRILATTKRGRFISQGLMIALSLILTLIAIQIARNLKYRLDSIRTQLQQVADGNLFVSINDQRNDELGELARGFDSMLKRLRTSTFSVDQLNEEVHRHTATLRNQQEYLRTLIEAEPAGVITLDRDSRILSINNAGARILHTPVDQALEQSFCEQFVADTDRTAFGNLIQSAFAGHNKNLQYRLRTRIADKDIWLQTYAVPFIDHNGNIISIITVSHDITGRVLEEQRLREARAFLQNVVDSVHDAMVVRDIKFNIRLLNRAARESEAGHPCNRLQHPDTTATQHGGPAQRLLRGSARETEICSFTDASGNICHIELEATPLSLPDGSLNGVIEIYRDISENTRLLQQLHEEQSRLQQLAHHDQLTGLPNRTLFLDRLEQVRLLAERGQQSFALLFIDLDRFKEINDSLGHQAGDRVLQEMSRRLSACIRSSDTLARIGGDEFTIIMSPLLRSDDAAMLAQKLIECIKPPCMLDDHPVMLTTSVGISLYPEDGSSTESLIKNADAAMYRAKEDGKNVFRLYSRQLTHRAVTQLSEAAELRQAVAKDEFCVYYQTRFDLGSLRPIGMEAFARWQHPTRGITEAARFLPAAQGSDLIITIGNSIIEKAMQQTRQWRQQGFDPGVIALNLSARQMSASQVDWLMAMLEKHNCQAHWFELEVSETDLANLKHSIDLFEHLAAQGFELAIDDFGSGYSSVSSLHRLPLTRLKLDQPFVRALPGDRNCQGVPSVTLALGRSLGVKVCAEGVENQSQVDYLRNAGCAEVQGFMFSRPQPSDVITTLLSTSKPRPDTQKARA
ncbi:EAL domain-containing protein [Marinobacterium sedimentorum]|uniref:EAL domain-containing protein n=1 Tax=Marinobacterium sedimentorum TaxID=2927804 RepID=UPI0020C5D1C2|nr:EAL domain-containing protein [Marinobacterium sedimentorum]MCP8686730.1 EAL domain-containing protein [Marinobacterium sedimentorum]